MWASTATNFGAGPTLALLLFDGPAAPVSLDASSQQIYCGRLKQAADFLRGAARLTWEHTTRGSRFCRPCS